MENQNAYQSSDQDFLPAIRRVRVSELTIYEISETELDILERGSPDSLYLNFAIFLLSSAIALTISLLTTTPLSPNVYIIFVVFIIVGYLSGFLLLLLWRWNHTSVSDCIKTIRSRLPPEGDAQTIIFEENT